jgi:hypothetical protein
MTERSRSGARCRTLRQVNTLKGVLPRDTYGTLRYEMDNLGRRLVFVDWDNGMGVPVFPLEIEVVEQEQAEV